MIPIQISQTATGVTDWQPVDYKQAPFNCTVLINISGTATATTFYTVDNPFARISPVSISRTTTTATVTTTTKHGLTTSDYVRIIDSGDPNLDGLYKVVSVPTDTTFTYTVSNTGATTGNTVAQTYTPFRVNTVNGLSAITATTAANIAFPVRAVMTSVTAYTSGAVITNILQGIAR